MEITEMISMAGNLTTEIRKCINLYYYCDNKKLIYRHILKALALIDRQEVLALFADVPFDETSSLEYLKVQLLKLYEVLSNEFIECVSLNEPDCLVS